MSNDIATMYTKDQQQKCGHRGYAFWKTEKIVAIRPADYGDYILQRRKRRSKNGRR